MAVFDELTKLHQKQDTTQRLIVNHMRETAEEFASVHLHKYSSHEEVMAMELTDKQETAMVSDIFLISCCNWLPQMSVPGGKFVINYSLSLTHSPNPPPRP